MSEVKVNKVSTITGTTVTVGNTGDTIALPEGGVDGAAITDGTISGDKLEEGAGGIDGSSINASNLDTGTVAPARLGSGASS